MNEAEIFLALQTKAITPEAAVDELVKLGADRSDAEQMVAQHFGADDVQGAGPGEEAE